MSREILPCPFCGVTRLNFVEGSTFRWQLASCDGCGASCGEVRVQTRGEGTPFKWQQQAIREAIKAWNTRALAQPAVKTCVELTPEQQESLRCKNVVHIPGAIAQSVQPAVPEGWQLVPVVATYQMKAHALVACPVFGLSINAMSPMYEAMLAAAPQPPPIAQPVQPAPFAEICDYERTTDDDEIPLTYALVYALPDTEALLPVGTKLFHHPAQPVQPLTHEQRVDLLAAFECHRHEWHAHAILIDMVEAAHGIGDRT